MLFNKILCNYCFPYFTTSPTCSEAGGADDLVSLLIYVHKSSWVVLFKELLKESLHGNYNIQLLLNLGGSNPCLNLKPDPNLVHPSSF